MKNFSSVLAEFRLKKQGITCLMEERDGINKHIVKGKKKKKNVLNIKNSCYKN